uniref:Uncharacterized protein n=1 Tax=Hyaloperonospora arabidopsidis (strain Emoy2) TaxID=559515 RepID=M4BZ01_HYAAE
MAPKKKFHTLFQPANKLTYAVKVPGRGRGRAHQQPQTQVVQYRPLFHNSANRGEVQEPQEGKAPEGLDQVSGRYGKGQEDVLGQPPKGQLNLRRFVYLASNKMTFKVEASIADVIIKEVFFRNDKMVDFGDGVSDEEGTAAKKAAKTAQQKVNAMKLFVQKDDNSIWCTVTITLVMRFELSMVIFVIDMSFRQVAKATDNAKVRTSTTQLTGINDFIVIQYVRVMVGASLKHIADLLDHHSVRAISFADDGSTRSSQSFSTCTHTAENIFDMLMKFLAAFYEPWRSRHIGMSSDGENKMTGHHCGHVDGMVATAENSILWIWCAPHQIPLIVKLDADCVTDGT